MDDPSKSKPRKALERDWEQTKKDVSGKSGKELNQDAGDTVKQAVGKEPIPGPNTPNVHNDDK